MIRYIFFTIFFIVGLFGAAFVYRGVSQCEFVSCAKGDSVTTFERIKPVSLPLVPLQQDIKEMIHTESTTTSSISLFAVGDLMLGRDVGYYLDEEGEDVIFGPFFDTKPEWLDSVDMFFANLEGPFSSVYRETSKSIAFRFKPRYVSLVKRLGITHVSQANNHAVDMGLAGLEESEQYLELGGITPIGRQYSFLPEHMWHEEIVNGQRIGVVAIDDVTVRVPVEQVADMIQSKDTTVDHIIVQIHWGNEYQSVHGTRQEQIAHAFIDAGADIIIGHHPHVIQDIEIYKDKPIFYSLGNFVFDQYFSEETQQGMGVHVTIDDGYIIKPIFTTIDRVSVSFVDEPTNQAMLEQVLQRSTLDQARFVDGILTL